MTVAIVVNGYRRNVKDLIFVTCETEQLSAHCAAVRPPLQTQDNGSGSWLLYKWNHLVRNCMHFAAHGNPGAGLLVIVLACVLAGLPRLHYMRSSIPRNASKCNLNAGNACNWAWGEVTEAADERMMGERQGNAMHFLENGITWTGCGTINKASGTKHLQ